MAILTLMLARDEISLIIVGFFRPPPETINCVGRMGRRSRPVAIDAPTNAVKVAAPSSSDMPSTILKEKSKRSKDFGKETSK